MNRKNIGRSLRSRLNKWFDSIEDENIRTIAKNDTLVSGGAIVSLLNNEEPNDLDIYFKTITGLLYVSRYYVDKWNDNHPNNLLYITVDYNDISDETNLEIYDDGKEHRVKIFIKSSGVALDDSDENSIDDDSEPIAIDDDNELEEKEEKGKKKERKPYRPRYITDNAISLSDNIQLIIRFYGSIDEIHENFDFIHCTCSYDYINNEVKLPERALEAIINKELIYNGSKYPICSMIRTRKFIARGYTINAGQYLKMAFQINELNLEDIEVLKEQLIGVDSSYFSKLIDLINEEKSIDYDFQIDSTYISGLVDSIF
jgi:hypothetical protein